jgi:hypothetical protein
MIDTMIATARAIRQLRTALRRFAVSRNIRIRKER